MINFHRIYSKSDIYFDSFFELYEDAFPAHERRNLSSFENSLNKTDKFHAQAILNGESFIGILNYWDFKDYYYIEHFAITSKLRGLQTGSKVLTILKKQSNNLTIILEAELATDAMSERRIEFYKRNGFKVADCEYAQPPYDGKGHFIPMHILTSNIDFTKVHFSSIKEDLYKEVYSLKNKL